MSGRIHRQEAPRKQGADEFPGKDGRDNRGEHAVNGNAMELAGTLQPTARKNMPDVVATCRTFVRYFEPERTRIAFLSPDRQGSCLQETEHMELVDGLREIPSVEGLLD